MLIHSIKTVALLLFQFPHVFNNYSSNPFSFFFISFFIFSLTNHNDSRAFPLFPSFETKRDTQFCKLKPSAAPLRAVRAPRLKVFPYAPLNDWSGNKKKGMYEIQAEMWRETGEIGKAARAS